MIQGQNVKTSILVGYFVKKDEARGAYRELQRKGFRRAAVVSKTADAFVHTRDPFPRRRAFGALIAFVLFGILAYIASISLRWPEPILSGILSALIPILAGGFIGILFSGMWVRRSRFGVDRSLLEDHARWLVADETALILQTPVNTMRIPVAVLLGSGEIVPTIFVLHPKREKLIEYARSPGEPLSPEKIQEHAKRLAEDHPVDPNTERNNELLRRLEQACQRIHQVCSDLSEASKLEQNTPPTAEWLLDNEYIIESNARDVQLNLPRRCRRSLFRNPNPN